MRTRVYLGILILLAFVALLSLPAHAQFTTITMTNVENGDGLPLALGTTCWTGTNNAGTPIAYRAGTSGQTVTTPVCRDIINGAVQTTYKSNTIGVLKVADTTLTTPANVCFKVTVLDSSTGKVVLGSYAGAKSGYDCVQPSGSTWSFDTYTPAGTPNVVQVAGPTGPQGPPGLTISTASDIAFTGNVSVGGVPIGPPENANFVPDGDSLTAGNVVGAGNGWVDFAATMPFFNGHGTLHNVAVGGTTCADAQARYTANVHPLSPVVTGKPGYYFLECGHNDLANGGAVGSPENNVPQTGAATFAYLQALWAAAKADGYTVIAFTVPRSTALTGSEETERVNLNRLIQFTTGYDYFIDLDGLFTNPLDTTILSDGTHPTTGANVAFARHVSNAMLAGGSLGKINPTTVYGPVSAGVPPAGMQPGDMSFARTATTGVLYCGSDANCYFQRQGLSSMIVHGVSFGPNATGNSPTNAQPGDGFDVRSPTAGCHFFGSDNSGFICKNSGTASTITFPGTTTVTNGFTMPTLNITTGITKNGVASSAGQCWTNIGGVEGWGACSGTTVAGVSSIRGYCGGTATSSTTIMLFNFGQISSANCTATSAANVGAFLAAHAGTFKNLYVATATAGVNASSGVVTLYDNGVATALTCTIGTGTSCNDTTHTVTATVGHFYGLRITTQASETLASINATAELQ